MSSDFDEDGADEHDLYRRMWEDVNNDWDFNAMDEGGEVWSVWDEPPQVNDDLEGLPENLERQYSSSTYNDNDTSRHPWEEPGQVASDSRARESLQGTARQRVGNSSSSTNTATNRPQQLAQHTRGTHNLIHNRRRAPAPNHSENWLDRAATNRQSPFRNLHALFEPVSEDDSQSHHSSNYSHGLDIDDLLASDWEEDDDDNMAPTTRARETRNAYVDLTNDAASPHPPRNSENSRTPISLKRSAAATASTSQSQSQSQSQSSSRGANKRPRTNPTTTTSSPAGQIEEVDLTHQTTAEESLLQTQLTHAITAQQSSTTTTSASRGPLKIGQRQCIICMEPFTNATITACGHIYCHECLTQALVAGERNSERGVGNCPMCRKPVRRGRGNAVVPVCFMRRGAWRGKGEGKGRRVLG